MAFRGRGRGRGFGGSDFKFAKQEPFILFPAIELPDKDNIPEEKLLAALNFKFRTHFQSSPYHLMETYSGEETVDIERYSDKVSRKRRFGLGRGSLLDSGFMKLEPGYFPLELVRGAKFKTKRKVRWNPKRDLGKLDFLEELEKKSEIEDSKPKKKTEGEEDEEDEEEVVEEEEEEDDDDDDYGKLEDFQDDEDEFNQSDGDDEEAVM
ncbi:hypothetical protein SOVF_030990 isoform A [Spinacia oleracea]|nr:hypothetical protein SOVF_030990 isoform A [Spinacia oleracea]